MSELEGTQAETQDAKEAVSSPATEQTPPVGEQQAKETITPTVQQPVKERFEDNPGFKNVLRQRDSVRDELKKAQEANQKLMALLENQSKPKVEGVNNEQEQAAKQLRQILGIDELVGKLESLDKRNSEYSKSQTDSAFDKEEEKIAAQCQKFGLDMNEVVPELKNWLDEHPYFGNLPGDYKPGFFDIAFKALYFDKSTELAEKSAYAKQLKEKELLKKANSEAPSPGGTSSPKAYTGIKDKVRDMIESGGGLSF